MVSRKLINELIDWIKSTVLVMVVTMIITIFIFQPYRVYGSSMEPTFHKEGDMVLVFKTPYFFDIEPDYEDIVMIDSRVERERTFKDEIVNAPIINKISGVDSDYIWIKRVIGLSGDILEFREGGVFRNGLLLVEDYIKEEMICMDEVVVVPQNHVFVMGDNRNASRDSRQVGPIPLENVQGKVCIKILGINLGRVSQ
ncbi:signal peptidase I [Candidatus Contubernalis alkaliaceticus]|uniref:signal peptidase I n=1 Tax=Candidatus Contubernalis alkaliaceticus TaxID=338645 RepID=UPI001F4BECB8|nr:signal peptidase I [Candidatus Contubernalis alkalaceticus]UNC93225.1 signal peptidase I [Candidatus Contubernalis alkalaceticus]